MMMILFHVWPEQTYRFSTRKLLPSKKNRLFKESKPIIPYELLKSKSSNIPLMKEINVIGKGSSFDLNNIKKLNGPIFLVSYYGPLRIDDNGNLVGTKYDQNYISRILDVPGKSRDVEALFFKEQNYKEFKSKNITYAIYVSAMNVLEKLKKSGHEILAIDTHIMDNDGNYSSTEATTSSSDFDLMYSLQCRHISVAEKIYQTPLEAPYANWVPSGSFLPSVCALSYFAEKINVYGWDFYLNSSPERMGYWELFLNTYKFRKDLRRSKNFFESALINFYYGYQFSKLPNINIHGYMGQLSKHDKLMKRIERVLFN
jgi:hypothetical protein